MNSCPWATTSPNQLTSKKRARAEFAKLSNYALFEYLIAQNRQHPIEKIAHHDVAIYDFWLREELANRAGDLAQEPFGIMRFYRGNPLDSDADDVIWKLHLDAAP